MKIITIEKVIHKGESRIALRFPFDSELIAIVKELPGARWSQTMNCWHIPDNSETLKKLSLALRSKAEIDASGLSFPAGDSEWKKTYTVESEIPSEIFKHGQRPESTKNFHGGVRD